MRCSLRASKAVLAAVLLAGTLPMAGCMTAAAAGTAKATEDDADNGARSGFASDAVLVGIFGVEGSSAGGFGFAPWGDEGEGQTQDHMERAAQDGNVGDGRCEIWGFAYRADSKPGQVFLVFVSRDGQQEGTYTIDEDIEELRPIGDYDVNSDAAIDAAKDHNEGIREALDSDTHWVAMALGRTQEYENPIWIVMGGGGGGSASEDGFGGFGGGGGGMVMIDAVTGGIIMSHGGSGSGSHFGGWGGSA